MSDLSRRLADLSPQAKRELLVQLLRKQTPQHSMPSPSAPAIVPAPDERCQPFPLTPIQQAYWVGRGGVFELGNVGAHVYTEFETPQVNLDRLSHAWQQLIDRHDMLRVVLLPDGQQQVLKEVPPYQIAVQDLRGQDPNVVATELDAIRQRMSCQIFPVDRWPLFEILIARIDDQRTRVCMSCDLLIADLRSIQILISEWFQLYENPKAYLTPLAISFRDYVLAERALQNSATYKRSQEYWQQRIPALPPAPQLPLTSTPGSLSQPRFVRRSTTLAPECWSRLKARARQLGLTPAAVLLTAYAEILSMWSEHPRFTINLTIFNRQPLHPQVNHLVGEFTSVNLLEVDTSPQEAFRDRARRLQEQLWEDLDHRHFHGVNVLRELARRQGGVSRAVMPVVFTCDLAHDLRSPQHTYSWLLPGEIVYGVSQTPQLFLDHQAFEQVGALLINWDAVEGLFPDGLLQDMFAAEVHLLHRLADEEAAWQEVTRIPLPLGQLEQRAALNATEVPVPARLAHEFFADQVLQRPQQAAVIAADRTLTYAELLSYANQVGHRLRALGARPDTLVAVVMAKGWEQVVAVLGVLVAGAAYLPIDPKLPPERLRYVLENGEVDLALTQSWLDARLAWPARVQRLCLDTEDLYAETGAPLAPVQRPEDLAYVLFTSGSTGVPKGVGIEHRSVVNRMIDVNRRFGVGPEDRALALTALHHDLSVYDIFGVLSAGGTIVIPTGSAALDPAHWAQLMVREHVTVWNSVPAFMEMLVEYLEHAPNRAEIVPRSLRLVLLSGDWIPVTLPSRLSALIPGVQVISLGGPTETTVWDICYPIRAVDPTWKSIPYGQPMANARYHVLDQALEPRPVWVPGQLYIGGTGLARGYWRDEEKTRASFIHHPRTGERLYRSGDLGRYLPDGHIEFLGRVDFQVKIRGLRIELGEIEAVLRQHGNVREAVVTIVEKEDGNKRLVAYIVSHGKPAPTTSDMHGFLKEKLPEHMVPSAFMFLEALPLTPNGKVDRQALPDPGQPTSVSPAGPKREATDLERQVAELVGSVLHVDHVDPQEDLSNFGITSVDMMRFGALLEQRFGFRPEMGDVFRLTTISAVAEYYEQHRREGYPPSETSAVVPGRSIESLLSSFRILLDPQEREEFRKQQPGLRQFDALASGVQLPLPKLTDAELRDMYGRRRSHRTFSPQPVSLQQFGKLLSCLRQITLDGHVRYLYGSSGGLYAVQMYVHIKPDRVEGIRAGSYYYHPRDHRLVLLSAEARLDRSLHWPHNRSIFDAAAFSIFLIGQLSALGPIYGDQAMRFPFIEAGLISQLLETSAPACQIGLCQIGGLDFERIRDVFALETSHVFLHTLLGGLREETNQSQAGSVANFHW
jgi:pyochelin synthetase